MISKLRYIHDEEALFDTQRHHQVLKFVMGVTILTFIPLGIKNLVIGKTLLGLVLLIFEAALIIEAYFFIHTHRSLTQNALPLGLLILAMMLSIYELGMLVSYWLYPIVVTIVFIVPLRHALITNTLLIIGCGLTCFFHVDWPVALRFIAALIACSAISHFAVKAITLLQQELKYLSSRDALTGALNRNQLDAFLNRAITRTKRDTPCCIALIDIDKFKQVNDLYGHDTGDEVIRQVVETLNLNTRKLDLLFRLGGDEFLLLLENTEINEANLVMEKLCQHIRANHYPYHANVTLSAGVAQAYQNDETAKWVKRADIALYHAKENGRDQVCCSSD
ncbi:hypothetical protein A3K86_03175 [Photobacterium jeanii]|uniref:diguanylate cyclase n=2 Tax=Photobacterium jeanii TaxID=858640 RepID=A0A178KNA9_9GAMM|nr:hypothetical protein A3K86_03175 [Photobacterium jeanii]